MNKKLLAILLSVFLVFGLLPMSVLADTPDVAQINSVGYTSLQAAIDAAETGDTIELLDSVILSDGLEVPAGKNITIDLNVASITYISVETTGNAAITNRGNLTLTNGAVIYKSDAPDSTFGYATNAITNYGTLILNEVNVYNDTNDGSSNAVDNNSTLADTSLVINNSTLEAKKIALRQFANSDIYKNDVTVNGETSSITGAYATQVHLTNGNVHNASLTVNNGTLTATNPTYPFAVYSWSGGSDYSDTTIQISGGTLNGDVAVGGGNANGGAGAENVNISGGSMNAVYTYNSSAENIDISGGSFAVEPDPAYLANDFELVSNPDGSFGVALSPLTVSFTVNEEQITEPTHTVYAGETYTVYPIWSNGAADARYHVNTVQTEANALVFTEVGSYEIAYSATLDGYTPASGSFTLNIVPVPVAPPVTPKLRLDNFATTTGAFLDVAYFGREARENDVVTLKVSNSEQGDKYGLDYKKLTVVYEVEGATMVRDNYDYYGNPTYKDGIATEFMLGKGFNKIVAHIYYGSLYVGEAAPFYAQVN